MSKLHEALKTLLQEGLDQGGRRQKSFGGALCSNDDVIIVMTSLLLQYPAKLLVRPGLHLA